MRKLLAWVLFGLCGTLSCGAGVAAQNSIDRCELEDSARTVVAEFADNNASRRESAELADAEREAAVASRTEKYIASGKWTSERARAFHETFRQSEAAQQHVRLNFIVLRQMVTALQGFESAQQGGNAKLACLYAHQYQVGFETIAGLKKLWHEALISAMESD
jgi:hypothetical protein